MLSEAMAQKQEDYIIFKKDDGSDVAEDGNWFYNKEDAITDVYVLTQKDIDQIRQEGYDEGIEEDAGYDAGYDDGYQQGYDEGTAENEE